MRCSGPSASENTGIVAAGSAAQAIDARADPCGHGAKLTSAASARARAAPH